MTAFPTYAERGLFAAHPTPYTVARDAVMQRAWGIRLRDADTWEVLLDKGCRQFGTEFVRMRGYSCDEEHTPSGQAAMRAAHILIVGQPLLVRLELQKQAARAGQGGESKSQDRIIGDVWQARHDGAGMLIGALLVASGHARAGMR